MKSTRKAWLGWTALTPSLAILLLATGAHAQVSEYDPQTGSVRINGGNPYADYRTGGDPAVAQSFAPYPAYGGGWAPPQGVKLDPAFRAAAGLGGPSLAELDRLRFNIYSAQGDIAGVNQGFTNVGAFIPRRVFSDYNLFAINPRLLIDNSGNSGFNLGAIHRFYIPEIDRMFGHSYWWDFSRSYENEINQFGVSLESVGRYISYRFNANLTLGEGQRIYAQSFSNPQLLGNSIALAVLESFQAPLDNYSAEVAMPIPVLGKYGAEWGLGGYYLTGSGVEDTLGVSGRVQWQVTEDFSVNCLVTNDNLFNTNVSCNLELQLPDGRPSRVARPNPVVMSLVQSVQRNYQVKVATGQRTKYYSEINPKDNEPFQIAIIDPNGAAGGNGSTQSPFGSIADYMAVDAATRAGFDIILVQPRTDGTDTNLNTGITITSTQRLLGNGVSGGQQPTYTSTRGTFFLPGIVPGTRPRISNSGNPGFNVVTLAGNATEVANFTIIGTSTGSGIVSTGAIDGFNIHNNIITNVVDGIRITSNTSNFLDCPGEDVGILQNNFIRANRRGVELNHTGGVLTLTETGNTLARAATDGQRINVSGGRLSGSITDNNFINNRDNGLELNVTNGADVQLAVSNNIFLNNRANGFATSSVDGSDTGVTLNVTGNTFNANDFNGFLYNANSGVHRIVIGGPQVANGNIFTSNEQRAIDINLFGTALATTDIRNNTVTFTGAGGGGNIFLTGHDIDLHSGQLGFDLAILNYLRGSIPAAEYDIVVLGSNAGTWRFSNGTQTLPGFGSVTYIDTATLIANPALWDQVFAADAIMINSHTTVGGGDLNTAGSNAINGQLARMTQFVSNGGDIWANSSGSLATYYNFLPSGVLATGATIAGSNGFAPTAAGSALGITNTMVNGFPTHNSFPTFDPAFTVFETRPFDDLGTAIAPPLTISIGVANAVIDAGGFVTGSSLDAIRIRTSNTARLGPSFIRNNAISSYADNGILVTASATSVVNNLSILNNVFTNNGNSIHVQRLNSAAVSTMLIASNTQNSADLNGIFIETAGTKLPSSNFRVVDNNFSNSGESGLRVDSFDDSTVSLIGRRNHFDNNNVGLTANLNDNSMQTINLQNTTFDNNTDAGQLITVNDNAVLNFGLTNPVDNNATFTSSTSNNGSFGLRLIANDNANLNLLVTGAVSNNGSHGVSLVANDNSRFNLRVGQVGGARSVFNANVDAGVAILLTDNAYGQAHITNAIFSNTTDANTPFSPFNGEGLAFVTQDGSLFFGDASNSEFTSNAGSGIFGSATGVNTSIFSQIQTFTIGGRRPALGNLIEGNGRSGIEFVRTANGRIGLFGPVNIQNNTIRSNPLDGISLSSRQSFVTDFYVIQDNLITLNSEQGVQNVNAGIHLDARADAQLSVNIFRNQITNNVRDGILVTDSSNFPSDLRASGGNWFSNTITGNRGNGVNMVGAVSALLIGSMTNPAQGNVIANNGIDGINNVSAGSWAASNNLIQLNGVHGIDIGGVGVKVVRLVHNHITQNGTEGGEPGDGIEINNNSQFFNIAAYGNVIDFNAGRGIDILNQNDAFSNIEIGTDVISGQRTIINGNGGEGIYVVNTASATQTQNTATPSQGTANSTDQPAGATHKGLQADGSVIDTAFLQLSIDGAVVTANGTNDAVTNNFQATGIVLRVGTTGGNYGHFGFGGPNPGGFASDQIFGGVVASITNNTLGGNFGDDLLIESFTSTVDPATSTTTWNGTTFPGNNSNINQNGDPLARLDLAFRGNVFQEDPLLLGPPALVTAQGAYYDNDEADFKSRNGGRTAPDPNGPFASGVRRRNAQRQPLRVYGDGTILAPAAPVPNFLALQYMYPGMGQSTFRINTGASDSIATLQQTGFIFDLTTPLFSVGDAQGVFYPIGGNTQDFRSPWGWSAF